VLATLWALKHYDIVDYLLTTYKEIFHLPEVLRALQLLDAARQIRAIEKKIARLEKQHTCKQRTINILKGQINDLKKEAAFGT
jgi:predicted RNase H-like nuclease (RuvC/YqgF family)